MAVHWQQSIHKICFTKEHLKGIMGRENSDKNTCVTAYNNAVQEMHRANIKPTGNYFGGSMQVVPLKERVTGTPEKWSFEYPTRRSAMYKGQKHVQFNTVCIIKMRLVEQCTS